eukprot:TRINITY_DN46952_c0_g1_i1.p1 TRINITY_DN46952_c0_g1~~TRINITY_DN46952_c0_g1_i1.p1  ORF type:complete len:314 (+),score=95.89 TRINITY_DN46952_c0_g1_i1:51-992(+)
MPPSRGCGDDGDYDPAADEDPPAYDPADDGLEPSAAAPPPDPKPAQEEAGVKRRLVVAVRSNAGDPEAVLRVIAEAEGLGIRPTASLFAEQIEKSQRKPHLMEKYLQMWTPRAVRAEHYTRVFTALHATPGVAADWPNRFWAEFLDRLPRLHSSKDMQKALMIARKCGVVKRDGFCRLLARVDGIAAGGSGQEAVAARAAAATIRDTMRRDGFSEAGPPTPPPAPTPPLPPPPEPDSPPPQFRPATSDIGGLRKLLQKRAGGGDGGVGGADPGDDPSDPAPPIGDYGNFFAVKYPQGFPVPPPIEVPLVSVMT